MELSVITAESKKGHPVNLQAATKSTVLEPIPTTSMVASGLTLESMLGDLPTAHQAPPIGHRLAGQNCHGTAARAAAPAKLPGGGVSRIRFVYFPVLGDTDRRADYHRHLVVAEVLLDRVLAARGAGRRSMVPALDYAAEARATLAPPRELLHVDTLEYHRWYDSHGATREQPLTREQLAAEVSAQHGLSIEEARHRAVHHSHALPAADQAWLLDRRNTPLAQRPLNQAEFQLLVGAIEGIWQAPAGELHLERANRQIATRVAALLGGLLDEFVASPFTVGALSQAFSEVHFAHLRQSIESSRQAESACGVLLAGPKAWFAAKAARMRAEHQVGLAMSPQPTSAMRLAGSPVIAVLGGKLRTYMNGSKLDRVGASGTSETPATRSAG